MNSIFSSFDALCAELLGQTIKSSFASATSYRLLRNPEQRTSSPPQETNQRHQQPLRPPRFAPELDGLNCFETLINY
ncbi:hypothetical protein JCGZ_20380 [Jatropha curcas]|uniref:Avr9/Cf-9 rapidly elicited protein n=1 Tax=Jatropha curcas TaxID=180498 RepID=D3GC10_JATCU|nr:Avr9/Cf-9 rapidly elicited protein [Jatropha curcas]KDP25224.1 hypothetical protein JCGZ_20380 [Jatropha curcas]